jgi:vacuolar-type H+-ATPase subunit E/Vma4
MAETGIAAKILEAARAKAQAAWDEAAAKEQKALEASLAGLAAEEREKKAAAEKRLRQSFQQDLSAFRLVETNRLHALRRKLLDGVFAQAWDAAVSPERHRAWLERVLQQHCREGDVLVVPARQKDLFRTELKAVLARLKVTVSDEPGSFRAGFVAVRGTTRLNCSLDEAFRTAVRDAEIEAAKAVFEK